MAPSKARRCTRFLIWRSVMRSASAAVIPFSQEDPERLAEVEDGLGDDEGADERASWRSQASLFSRPASARATARPPMRPIDGRDGDEEAVVEREVGERDQDPGRERHLAPQGMQQRLKARQQEEEEEHDDPERPR